MDDDNEIENKRDLNQGDSEMQGKLKHRHKGNK